MFGEGFRNGVFDILLNYLSQDRTLHTPTRRVGVSRLPLALSADHSQDNDPKEPPKREEDKNTTSAVSPARARMDLGASLL